MSATTVVSYSEIDDFRQCPHKHHLAWRLRQRAEPTEAMAIGTAWHTYMEHRYKAIQAVQRGLAGDAKFWLGRAREALTVSLWWPDGSARDADDPTRVRGETVAWMAEGYKSRWADVKWEVLAVELEFEVPLPNADGSQSTVFHLKGHIDLIIRDEVGRIWIVDHKTFTSRSNRRDMLRFEIQPALYLWTWNNPLARFEVDGKFVTRKFATRPIVGRQLDGFGVVYNRARRERLKTRELTPGERFERISWTFPERHLEQVARDATRTARKIRALDEVATNEIERTPDERCGWRCGYVEPCLTGLSHGSNAELAELVDSGLYTHKPREARSDG